MTHDPMVPNLYKVEKYQQDIKDTFTIELHPIDKEQEFTFVPGQFCMVHAFGVGESAISISGDPHNKNAIVHTIRAVGSVTKILGSLHSGNVVGIRGPFGVGWPMEKLLGKNVIIAVGGIGLPPLRPVIYHILRNRKQYKKVTLFVGTRTPKDLLFENELDEWKKSDIDVHITVDKGNLLWRGHVGKITELIDKVGIEADNAIAMICGPEIMIHYSALSFIKMGLIKEAIYVSMERNMQCGVGYCGHCLCGSKFICKDGPVFTYSDAEQLLTTREL